MYFEELLTFFFVGVTMAVFSLFFVTFFFRIDLLVGVLFVGCFFAIVLFFHKKKAWISPDVKIMTHLHTSLFQKKNHLRFIQDIVYVRIFYGLLRRKRY